MNIRYKKRKTIDPNLAAELSKKAGISILAADLLLSNGIDGEEEAFRALNPGKEDFLSPFLMPDMRVAAERVSAAIENGERIVIYGDYDCDGVCAVAILYGFLRDKTEVFYYIPSRKDGYGLSAAAIDKIAESVFPDLIITVDCGVASACEVEYAKELGIDVIITDHHTPQEVLPDAPILNPKVNSSYEERKIKAQNTESTEKSKVCDIENAEKNKDGGEKDITENGENAEKSKENISYIYKNPLCGAGVALKLVEAIGGFSEAERFLDVAAIATVGDVVPLTGENRAITAMGLQALNAVGGIKRKGLKKLCAALKLDKITASDIAFIIAPRLNAAGRMGVADRALELLVSDDYFDIDCLIKELNADNQRRQAASSDIADDVFKKLLEEDLSALRCIVLADGAWDGGVLGIACSKIAEQFNRPAVLFTEKDGIFKGSARSIDGVNIYDALSSSKELFTAFGGHAQAAGLSLKCENFDLFKANINNYLKKYDENIFAPEVIYDVATGTKPTLDEIKEIARLEPFGEGNPKPLFLFFENEMNFMRIKGTRHIRERNAGGETVGFNMLDGAEILNGKVKKAVLTTVDRAEYNNVEYLKSVICGFYAEEPEACFERTKLLEGYVSAVMSGKKQKIIAKNRENTGENTQDISECKKSENKTAQNIDECKKDENKTAQNISECKKTESKTAQNIEECEKTENKTAQNSNEYIQKTDEFFSDRVKRFEENQLKCIIKDTKRLYGTAFVAFDDKTAVDFYRLFNETADNLLIFCYRAAESKNPYNRLILSPKDMSFDYYDRVVFLDKPFFDPSEYTDAEVFVSNRENPLDKELGAANLSEAAIKELYVRIRSLIKENAEAETIRAAYARAVRDQKFSYTEFVAALSIFVELGLIKASKDFRLILTENKTSLENSKIYRMTRPL
jgi:single-stranded-DNA-specific exonuclease